MDFKLKTAANLEVLTLAEAKEQLRVDSDITEDDSLITALVAQATDYAEKRTRQPLLTQTWTAFADRFCDVMELKPNLQNVVAVKYIDVDGVLQTLDTSIYNTDKQSVVGAIYLAYGQTWPTVRCERHAVQIEFTCGYDAADKIPDTIISAIKLLITDWYEFRGSAVIGSISSEVPISVDRLLDLNKVWTF